jgi:hypothetical protein
MATLLVDRLIEPAIKVEVTREPGSPSAILTVKNNAPIDQTMRTAHIFESANMLFRSIIENLLFKQKFSCTGLQHPNLSNPSAGTKEFSASVTFYDLTLSDDELKKTVGQAIDTALEQMAKGQFVWRASHNDPRGGRGNVPGGP